MKSFIKLESQDQRMEFDHFEGDEENSTEFYPFNDDDNCDPLYQREGENEQNWCFYFSIKSLMFLDKCLRNAQNDAFKIQGSTKRLKTTI